MLNTSSIAGLLKPGDYAIFLLGCFLVLSLFLFKPQNAAGQTVVVRAKGQIVAELSLHTPRTLNIAGTMGNSVIEIVMGKARIIGDPGPRQICVKQGWISRAGDALLCLANQVTLEIPGPSNGMDTLNY